VTERQKYEVISFIDDVEVRRYLPYVSADIVVNNEYEKAANQGFRPLANYIFSNNIAMTAPVIVQEKSEGADKWQVSFVMPSGSKIEDMPKPQGKVELRAEQEEICAAIKFSGYTGSAKIEKLKVKLMKSLEKQNILINGKVRIARFDPPWKPGFLRHNELVVPIIF
jgi:hypothetical protein